MVYAEKYIKLKLFENKNESENIFTEEC